MNDEERRQAGDPEEASENAADSGEPDRPAELPDLPAELEEALREKDQFRSLAQRVTADLENYKRRAVEEREELRRFGQSQLILKVLGVSDDFQRAMEMVPEDAIAPGWREGLELVQRGIDHLLESEGVTAIEAEGEPFEPHVGRRIPQAPRRGPIGDGEDAGGERGARRAAQEEQAPKRKHPAFAIRGSLRHQ